MPAGCSISASTPKLAAEVTLQPIQRFGFDAAILFSDILVVPHALGRRVAFAAGEGPQLDPLDDPKAVSALRAEARSGATCADLRDHCGWSRPRLPANVTLLGFCGAPWTVATYMVAGHGTPDQAPARLFAYRDPEAFARLIERLVEASAGYLVRQLEAGVDAVQIFDTWAGVLPPEEFERWCIAPTRSDRRRSCGVPYRSAKIIGFPRGAGTQAGALCRGVPVDAVGLDWMVDLDIARDFIQKRKPVQGNLDPLVLLRRWRCARPQRRRDPCGIRRRPVHLQSRPRHSARHADRACRADAQACAAIIVIRGKPSGHKIAAQQSIPMAS